ncbi:MAG: YIP1 family protein [Longimicrobiaceae bacterium]
MGDDPLGSLWETWRDSTFRPSRFFAQLPPRNGYLAPVGYLLIVSVIGALFTLFWQVLFASAGVAFLTGGLGRGENPFLDALLSFFLTPFAVLLLLFVWGAIVHLLLKVASGAQGGFQATIRAVCYSAGPSLFAIIPVLGGLAGVVWSIVLEIIGLRQVHRTSSGKAAFAVLLPLFGCLTLVVTGVVLAVVLGVALAVQ